MFFHRKETMMPVDVKKPDPRFGQYLLEQFGGATGELTAALTYWVQSFHITDAGIRDMLQDIAIEEFSHLEMVGKLIEQHTSKLDQKDVYDAPLFRIRGMGPHFVDSQGHAWTAAYINEGGNVVRDLRSGMVDILAALVANGVSEVDGVEEIDRGYENIDERLRQLGADITRG